MFRRQHSVSMVTREIDLVEEIARLYGYGRIPVTLPKATGAPSGQTPRQVLDARMRSLLTGSGYSEIVTYSFVPSNFPALLGLTTQDEALRLVRISNPLTEDQAVMRTTMIYNLLDVLARNVRAGNRDLRVFELGRVFLAREKGVLPEEKNRLACLIAGLRSGLTWHAPGVEADFYDLKGTIESLLSALDLQGLRFIADTSLPYLHPGRACRIQRGDEILGVVGEVHPRVMEAMDVKSRAMVCELDMDAVLQVWKGLRKNYPEASRFPRKLARCGLCRLP